MAEPRTITKTFDIKLGDTTASLRLTIAAQLRLEKEFKEETLNIVLGAANSPEKLIAVFNEALSYKDNPNNGMTGEELYDALVDNGYKGTDVFANLVFEIANVSGLLSDKQTKQVSNGISKTYAAIFDSIENGVNTDELTETADNEEGERLSFPTEAAK